MASCRVQAGHDAPPELRPGFSGRAGGGARGSAGGAHGLVGPVGEGLRRAAVAPGRDADALLQRGREDVGLDRRAGLALGPGVVEDGAPAVVGPDRAGPRVHGHQRLLDRGVLGAHDVVDAGHRGVLVTLVDRRHDAQPAGADLLLAVAVLRLQLVDDAVDHDALRGTVRYAEGGPLVLGQHGRVLRRGALVRGQPAFLYQRVEDAAPAILGVLRADLGVVA